MKYFPEIGINVNMYIKYLFPENVHYIAHNNTLERKVIF